jgi:hypothetical protein
MPVKMMRPTIRPTQPVYSTRNCRSIAIAY